MSLQLASGAFPLDAALCDAINVPMDKLKWTSPFNRHRSSLGHLSHSAGRRGDTADNRRRSPCEPEAQQLSRSPSGQVISSEVSALSRVDSSQSSGSGGLDAASPLKLDPESLVWATAVALAWLEHSSASYFIEWEMIAAKASMWLSAQDIPEGRDLASIKAAANQLFIILRHWDDNLQLNMLCYNPNSV